MSIRNSRVTLVGFLAMLSGVAFAQEPASAEPATLDAATEAKPRERTVIIQRAVDRLDLSTTVVTGNRELPRVLYIVPWKKAELGELPAQPFNTLLDEVLEPVDRDVFKRQVKYFHAVHSGAAAAKSDTQRSPEKK